MKKRYTLLLTALALLMANSCLSTPATKSYEIGETGPGEGYIFYAENGTYMECTVRNLGRGNWNEARTLARNHRGGGKRDWRLPTLDELDLIYKNMRLQGVSGFNLDRYWSSEQDKNNTDSVLVINFLNGDHESYKNTFQGQVRAVRVFK